MDDGGREKSLLGMHLDVSAFTPTDKTLVKKAIENLFDIDISFHHL